MNLDQKQQRLETCLREMSSVLVAYSGGIDSSLVLAVACKVLGENALAVTADSPSLPRAELQEAEALARSLGARHETIRTAEIENPDYLQNPVNRCYFCKSELYSHLKPLAEKRGLRWIVNGTNLDDLGDYRPGLRPAEENNVRSPLVEAGFGKEAVRALARKLGLPNWDKPAMACLASRIPYGQAVTRDKLDQVERAEAFLRGLGYRQVRVRHFGTRARVEFGPEELAAFLREGDEKRVEAQLRAIGFDAVDIDPEGYRPGRLNEDIDTAEAGRNNHVSL